MRKKKCVLYLRFYGNQNLEKYRGNLGKDKSKFHHLTQETNPYPFNRKRYMKRLNRNDTSIIFRTRARMLKVKANYKKGNQSLMCKACKVEEETQLHVLTECNSIHEDDSQRIRYEDIFEEEDMDKLRITAKKIEKTMKILEDIQKNENKEKRL